MKWWKVFVFIAVAVFLLLGFYNLNTKNKELNNEVEKVNADLDALKKENSSLSLSLQYFKEPKNLLKELKSQFNYVESGEKLIIVVPKTASSTLRD